MAQSQTPAPNMDQFEAYFQRADLDRDGRVSGNEAVSFFQATNLPRPVLAKIWTIADENKTGFLGRQEFYNALKLVTVAQSNRDLTQDIVRAALYSEASARIPPPQLNLPRAPAPRPNIAVGSSVPPANAVSAPQNVGLMFQQSQVKRPPTQINIPQAPVPQPNIAVGSSAPTANAVSAPQSIGLTSQQSQVMRPPRPPLPSAVFQSPQVVNGIRPPQHGGSMAGSQLPNSSAWLGGNTVAPQAGVTSQPVRSVGPVGQDGLSMAPSGLPPSTQSGVQTISVSTQPALPKPSNNQAEVKDSKALAIVGNGHAPDSLFGDVFSVTSVQAKQDSTNITSGVSTSPISSVVSMGAQPTVKSSSLDPSVQITNAQHTVNGLHQQGQLSVKPNQQVTVQATSGLPTGATGQSQVPWPRMTQSDVLKYSKVFMQVDTDRDGKITGEQARNLFLSWRQPREVLKKVWDLSDQDKDSMLSLREFCIALYLMERYREGRPLPAELPSGIMLDETLSVSGQPATHHENAAWRSTSGYQQSQTMKGVQPGASFGKPPRPVPIPQHEDSMQSSRQKPKVPVLEKHILNQLSSEEQNSLNSKFQEATDAEKKVAELEKEIVDAREKIQFYHAKMQELILYKSRCDNRLNEIAERVSADRREVESLGKKYEEKYRQAGDVASKLTIEEATFRDIQDKKMELYRAIFKLEQDGDGVEERANRIQSDLEELVIAVNERCKTYGLRAKPTSLVELPFGWQAGIQEGAADWDENWDSFEDEGFVIVKELTLDVQNVVAPPKAKASLRNTESSRDEDKGGKSSSDADEKLEKEKRTSGDDGANTQSEEKTATSPPESPARRNALESEYKEVEDSHSKKDISFDGSPQANRSEHGAHETMFDRGFDETGWGTFDLQYDTDGALDFNHLKKDMESDRQSENSFFGSDNWGLNPIRTSTTQRDNMYPKQSPFFDSVPSTPNYNMGSSPLGDSLFQRKSPFGFADSVPSTPMSGSNNSPQGLSEGAEERSFENGFSRFDSFNAQDGGLFTPREPMSFSRFDSMRSTRDSEYDHGASATRDTLARFDSFRSMADSDYNFGLFPPREQITRFDSIRSSRDSDFGYRFSSFDDADPYGSNDAFKTAFDGQTPRRESGWSDDFTASFDGQTPRRESDSWNDHFKASFDSQSPRRDSDSWNDPFKKFESQTPRRDSGGWNAF